MAMLPPFPPPPVVCWGVGVCLVSAGVDSDGDTAPPPSPPPQVVCAVGAPEDAILDSSAPRRIDGDGTIALINAAADVGTVQQFVLVCASGEGMDGGRWRMEV